MPSPARPLRILTVTHNYPRFSGDPAGAFVARIAEGPRPGATKWRSLHPTRQARHGRTSCRGSYSSFSLCSRSPRAGGLHRQSPRHVLCCRRWPRWRSPAFSWPLAWRSGPPYGDSTPDVVHAHWWCRLDGSPAGDGALPHHLPWLGRPAAGAGDLVRRMALPAFRRAARITTVSKFLAERHSADASGARRPRCRSRRCRWMSARFLRGRHDGKGRPAADSLCWESGAEQGSGRPAAGRWPSCSDGGCRASSRFWVRDRLRRELEALARRARDCVRGRPGRRSSRRPDGGGVRCQHRDGAAEPRPRRRARV